MMKRHSPMQVSRYLECPRILQWVPQVPEEILDPLAHLDHEDLLVVVVNQEKLESQDHLDHVDCLAPQDPQVLMEKMACPETRVLQDHLEWQER